MKNEDRVITKDWPDAGSPGGAFTHAEFMRAVEFVERNHEAMGATWVKGVRVGLSRDAPDWDGLGVASRLLDHLHAEHGEAQA